jgi:hypothetical protein
MFFSLQNKEQQEEYEELLKIVGCLSNLFSDSETPYLYYRVAEKIFCQAFKAEDLSRSDVSADAKMGSLGIGLKTFLAGNNKTLQKVAEFNGDRPLYDGLSDDLLVRTVSELRNSRIDFTEKVHGLDSSIYHCVLRDKNIFKIFEEPMHKVNISNIRNIKRNPGSIVFEDGINEYSFLLSKSTLTKRFTVKDIKHEFEVSILKNPLEELRALLNNESFEINKYNTQTIYLPLYGRDKKQKHVFPKSGLNQWNARGRVRHPDEVYIPIPAVIHQQFPDFFPNRDILFTLKFPDGERVESSVCQDGRKALMSQSNRKLGKLILRDGLKLKEGELVTYEKLQLFGIDSVRIDKVGSLKYEINFAKNGSYEIFKNSWV